jgi:spermidine/putrescine transport system permease protein
MNKKAGVVYSLPMTIWLTFLFVLPSLGVIAISFLKKGLYGGAELKFSFEGYTSLINPSFFKVLINTIEISVLSTLITVLIAIPVALYIATSNKKTLLLLLIIIPFWTNFLIRVYAWIAILGNNGFLNNFLIFLRDTIPFLNNILQNAPYRFMYNKNAIILITVYCYLPYAILPLYSTIEKFDFSLIDAARDLGANKITAYLKIFIPSIKAGIITAVVFTFIPALGSFAIPKLVGDQNSYMLGNIIANELTVARNWPKASAISTLLIIITIILIFISNKNENEV